MNKHPPIASAIYNAGKVTYNYTDGTSETQDIDMSHQIDLFPEQLDKQYAERQQEIYEKRKAEGRCTTCGSLREMSFLGLKECESCLN